MNGIWGGFQGEGAKTIIPAHAHAKVSCRLVADQDPDRIFERFRDFVERSRRPASRRRSPRSAGAGRASRRSTIPATQAAARALEATFGAAAGLHPRGRQHPGRRELRIILGLPVVLLGFTQPDDQAHAPDEWMDLRNYETGIRAVVRALDELATIRLSPPDGRQGADEPGGEARDESGPCADAGPGG